MSLMLGIPDSEKAMIRSINGGTVLSSVFPNLSLNPLTANHSHTSAHTKWNAAWEHNFSTIALLGSYKITIGCVV